MFVDATVKDQVRFLAEQALRELYHIDLENLEIEFPPDIKLGDLTIPCFKLAAKLKQSSNAIAASLGDKLASNTLFEKVSVQGAYVNLRLSAAKLFGDTCREVTDIDKEYGQQSSNGQKVMVEYLSPNTNKPLHLGHVRNGCIGMSVSRIMEAAGYDVVKANFINDRGIHICKSMLAWQKWANGDTPASTKIKGDLFVGDYYVMFNKEYDKQVQALMEQGTTEEVAKKSAPILLEAQELLRKWEEGDPETVDLWKTMNGWVYQGFAESYEALGFAFDQYFYESETYKLGKDIVQEGLKKGVFVKEDSGAIVAPLPAKKTIINSKGKEETVPWFGDDKQGNPRKATVQREDGTSLYMTQDLGTAKLKFDLFGLDRSVYVVGKEQDNHFATLFCILGLLGYDWVKGCYHLSYGMVELPTGKMKSRTGTRVDADDLLSGMEKLAAEQIAERDQSLSDEEVKRRARKIALAAIKFYLLMTSPRQGITFDPKASIEFEGFTGPYCQYSYARASSILNKAASNAAIKEAVADFSKLGADEERVLIQKLCDFPNQVKLAAEDYNPTRMVSYAHDLARAFNQFYHKHQVISAKDKSLAKARLELIEATRIVLENALSLLGIDVLETM